MNEIISNYIPYANNAIVMKSVLSNLEYNPLRKLDKRQAMTCPSHKMSQ